MRTRHLWLIVLALIVLPFTGACEDDDEDLFGGSDTLLQRFFIGSVAIQADGTYIIPLSSVTTMRFELSREVTRASLGTLFDFEILITNLDTGDVFRITTCNLQENGDLYWPDTTNKVIEFRGSHPFDYLMVGGDAIPIGSPGNTFEVKVVFLIGRAADGTQFALTDDVFYIVWTDSSQTL